MCVCLCCAQVNPALTLALLATRRLEVLRAVGYLAAQCSGAFLASGALYLALPLKTTADHFVSRVSRRPFFKKRGRERDFTSSDSSSVLAQVPLEVNAAQAVGIEALCTFQMVFTVFSSEEMRRRESPEPGHLAIGLAHTAGVLIGVRGATRSSTARRHKLTELYELRVMYICDVILSGTILRCQYEPCTFSGSGHRHWILGKPLGEKSDSFSDRLYLYFVHPLIYKEHFTA